MAARVYLVFRSTHETLKAESLLKAADVSCKVVMKPSAIRLDCGMAVRVAADRRADAISILDGAGLTPRGIFDL